MTAIYLSLAGVSIIPILITLMFPKNRIFFDKNGVKGFGLGVYLMLVILLLREAIEHGGLATGGGWFFGGLAFSVLIGFTFKEFHHHHNEDEKAHSHNKSSTWRVLISDFFHNIVDGIAIIAGFSINIGAGITSFLGILGHQIVQQGGQQVLLVESKVKPNKAILISFIVSLSIFLGFIFAGNEAIEVIFMALSSGIVAWKVGTDMIHANWNKKMILGFMVGALILALILVMIPHEH
jgi:zinc transporter ZupT